jgi:hypothetical protein
VYNINISKCIRHKQQHITLRHTIIQNTKQNWAVGNTVNVGFLKLVVLKAIPTPKDYAPDAYIMQNVAGTQHYKFVPHKGVEKLTVTEVAAMLASATL